MIKRFALYGFLFLILISTASAQKMIAFDKRGKVKRVRYFLGEEIKVGLLNKVFVYGQITRIEENQFSIGTKVIQTDSVKYVYSRDQSAVNLFSEILFTAGAAYFPLVTFNRAINSDRPIISETAAIISGSLITGGILLNLLTKKKYKISAKRPLKIIDLSP